MAVSSGFVLIIGVCGCGLMLGVVGLVVWAILDNARKNAPRDQ